jgi:hypothetical protein
MYKFLTILLCVMIALCAFGAKVQVIEDCCVYDTYWTKQAPNNIVGNVLKGTVCEVKGIYADYAELIPGPGVVWTSKITIASNGIDAVVIDKGVSIRSNTKAGTMGILLPGAKIKVNPIVTWYNIVAPNGQFWIFYSRVKAIK